MQACSTGGTLAACLLTDEAHAAGIEALVLVSPNFGVRDGRARILTWPWGAQLARLLIGESRSFTPINAEQRSYWTTRYPTGALVEMMALVDLAGRVPLEALRTPTLLVHTAEDRVVDPEQVGVHFARLGASPKRRVVFEASTDPAGHVLAGDVLSPEGTEPLLREIRVFLDGLR